MEGRAMRIERVGAIAIESPHRLGSPLDSPVSKGPSAFGGGWTHTSNPRGATPLSA
jgi:hypothetical protein